MEKLKIMSFFLKRIKLTQSGFTLMELMIVIAIAAIVSAFAIPNFSNAEHRVKKVARELMGSMQKTRVLAVKTNRDVAIEFDDNLADGTPSPRYLISTQDDDGNPVPVTTVAFTDHGAGVQYNDGSGNGAGPVTYGSNILTFNSRGTCNGGFVYISYGDSAYRIGTLSTGVIRIQRLNGSSWP